MKKSLFLDRDGVINRMVKYGYGWDSPQKLQDVRLVRNIEKVISWAKKHKILVVEVSNQPGVAKGKMSQKTSDAIEKKIHRLLKEKGAVIDKAYICLHHPHGVIVNLAIDCDCRKPKPGLILNASEELSINLEQSIFLGDKASDVDAAKNAGVKSILYLHDEDEPSKNEEAKHAEADFKTSSIEETLKIAKNFFKLT